MRMLVYDIAHDTSYDYSGTVSVSHHTLRLCPRHLSNQVCLDHSYAVEPGYAKLFTHEDYFGNREHFVTVEGPHQTFSAHSRSRVAVSPRYVPEAGETPSWIKAKGICRTDRSKGGLEAMEYLYESPHVVLNEEVIAYAEASFGSDRPLLEAVQDLTHRIFTEFTFDPLATDTTTAVSEIIREKRGVCQDFAHLEIACLRAMGIPARYVSGYLETDPPPGQVKLVGADCSHAWISFFCPGVGWVDVDPTNNCLPSMRHITLAWGRDYDDITPIRGVVVGGGEHILRVRVDVSMSGAIESTEELRTVLQNAS